MENSSLLGYLLHWFVSALALMVTAFVVPGFKVRGFSSALIAAVVIGIANVIIWPIVFFLTLPLTIITLGLFTFVVNAIVLRICAAVIKGFDITSWFSAIIGAVILTLVGTALHALLV